MGVCCCYSNMPKSKVRKLDSFHQRSTASQEGSIVRIKCENFLTYDSVEVHPGPNLNMIIGPNGTGKSSVVCAICLGLGGKTSTVGRASHVGDYVKHGCNSAVIEIELYNPVGANTVVHRQINKNNSSTWTINDQPANLRTVEELVSKLNIQVGNLCQFLPQDRVSDFARMLPHELLENTEKAVGGMDMFENHISLKQHSAKVRDLSATVNSSKTHLETEKQANSRLEEQVNNFHEYEKITERIDLLKKKKPWLEFNEVREQFISAKKKKAELYICLANQRKSFEPLQEKIAVKKTIAEDTAKEIQEFEKFSRKLGSEIVHENRKIENLDEKLAEILHNLKAKKQDDLQRQHRLNVMKQQLEGLKREFSEIKETDEDAQPVIDSVTSQMQRVSRNYSEAQFGKTTLLSEKTVLEKDINANEITLKQLQDVRLLRMDILRKVNKNAYTAAKWLENNGSRFQGKIYGPIMITLNVIDNKYAKFVETHISYNDMIAFVCEDSTDMNNFLKCVRDEQNIKVNTVLMPEQSSSSFIPKHPVSFYRKWSFHSYIKDLFTAPDPVMAYLCKQYSVHYTLVGTHWTKDNISTVLQESGLKFFYTENHQYVVRKSHYGNKSTSTRCTEINHPKLLTHSVDVIRQTEVSEANKVMKAKLAGIESTYQELKQNEIKYKAELEDLRRKKKELLTQRDNKKSLQAKINQKKQTIQQFDSDCINIELEEQQAKDNMQKINSLKIDFIKDILQKTRRIAKYNVVKINKCLFHGLTLNCCYMLERNLRDCTTALQGLEQECEKMRETVRKKKDEAKRLRAHANEVTGTKSDEEFPEKLKNCFMELPKTIPEIDSKIHDLQAQKDCLLQIDSSVIEEYKKREVEIKQMSENVKEKELSLQAHVDEIERLKECWLPPLKELIEKIDENFSHFLSSLSCAGEISIKHGDDPNDFGKYGISIKVKYRDSEKLQELSVHQQSGGERSVATVLYLLALQELTKCPFRCVDEINQGMDSTNERKVFELVVQIACKKNCSQYFLLTPKLLPDLDYTDNMTVLCVFNGSKMMDHGHWNLAKFIRRRKKLVV